MKNKSSSLSTMRADLLSYFPEYEKMAMMLNQSLLEMIKRLLPYAPEPLRVDSECIAEDSHLQSFEE